MIQGGGSPRFPAEALQRRRIASQIVGQELQSDAAAEQHVFRLVDHTHPAAAQLAKQAVMRNRLADSAEWRRHPQAGSDSAAQRRLMCCRAESLLPEVIKANPSLQHLDAVGEKARQIAK